MNIEETINKNNEVPELTIKAIITGIIIGIVFGIANAYLGLKVGLTVSASIPAAVMAVAVFKVLFKGKSNILEINIVQTIGSAGESVAAGCIFTIPALFLWNVTPSQGEIICMALCGGLLGVIMMVPLRRYLIVKEHDKLPYPEGTACAEVLKASQKDASKAKPLFMGLLIGSIYQALMHNKLFNLWNKEPSIQFKWFKGAEFSAEVTPELLGIGYIIGPKISAIQFAGGLMGWMVLIPLLTWLGQYSLDPIFPATMPLRDMQPGDIWANYIRYIGAGGVAFAGIFSLIKSIPIIIESFQIGLKNLNKTQEVSQIRTNKDMSIKIIGFITIIIMMIIVLYLNTSVFRGLAVHSFSAGLLILFFSFFFVVVSSRLVGLLGSSSNPISGMVIATLLITSLFFLIVPGMKNLSKLNAAILTVGAFVCIAAAVAGDTSQDLKTGYLVGSTPQKQQIGEIIGVVTSGLVMGIVMYMMKDSVICGDLQAPQANLMKIVVDGVVGGNLPWGLVIIGAFMALCVELLGVNSLAFSCGLYLPLSLSSSIIVGGLIRFLNDKKKESANYSLIVEKGTLYSSGLIAGASLLGIVMMLIAGFAPNFNGFIDTDLWKHKDLYAIIAFLILTCTLFYITRVSDKETQQTDNNLTRKQENKN